MRFKVLLWVMVMLAFGGCTSNEQPAAAAGEGRAEHRIESDELRLLMRELNMVVYERQKSELERDDVRRRYALSLAAIVKELSGKIADVPADELGGKLTEKAYSRYENYAQQLNRDGDGIETVARNYELEKLEKKIMKMERTCDSCHALFRGYHGQ